MSLTIERLRKAIELAAAQPGGIDYQQELDEVLELERRLLANNDYDIWGGSIEIVATGTMIDLMNIATYDTYGKLARANAGEVDFELYAAEIRKYSTGIFTDENLHCGYDVVKDLWHDNEAEGNNNEDGTFRRC